MGSTGKRKYGALPALEIDSVTLWKTVYLQMKKTEVVSNPSCKRAFPST